MRCGGQCAGVASRTPGTIKARIELMKPWVRKFSMEIASEKQAKIERNLEGEATVSTAAPSFSGVRRST